MTPQRLHELIRCFAARRIAVVGDFFLDKYLDVDPALVEPSLETGLEAHQVVAVRCSAGAAGTVVNNLAALGAGALHSVGAVGNDGEAFDLRACLTKLGCATNGLRQFDCLRTPTYLKPRDKNDPSLAGEHSRYDTKNRTRIPAAVITEVRDALVAVIPHVDAVIVADQVEDDGCGVIDATVRDLLAEQARRHPHVIFWADSRKRVHEFRGVIVKPNQFEAVGHMNPAPGARVDLDRIMQTLPALRTRNGNALCVTLGERGMLVSDPEITHVPTVGVPGPIDPTGAGDSATAGAVLALASGATLPEAALIGNLVASITIQQLATTGTATPNQLIERLNDWRKQHGF